MSNSSELFLVDNDPEVNELEILLRSTSEFSDDGRLITTSEVHQLHRQGEQNEQRQQQHDEKEDKDQSVASSEDLKLPLLGEGEFTGDDDDDGFRTPTSLDHKIPVILQCPPAPRKIISIPSKKRKASSTRRQLLLNLSDEIESLFPPALFADHGRKMKKVRGNDAK
nr:TPA_asm: hypothetical protein HUJ06_027317 [Nelumbo nucifera]